MRRLTASLLCCLCLSFLGLLGCATEPQEDAKASGETVSTTGSQGTSEGGEDETQFKDSFESGDTSGWSSDSDDDSPEGSR